jgi:alginate O-acetyltransferase complex protein AlgJ
MAPKHLLRLLFAVLAVGFFATPIALRALGVTAEAFENRPFAEAPKLSQGWDAFQQTSAFLTDRMPLRAQAVRANTRIWTDVFDTTPRYRRESLAQDQALPFAGNAEQPGDPRQLTPEQKVAQVLAGEDGWLFLIDEQNRSCGPPIPFGLALLRWEALVSLSRRSGARTALLVPPDKSAIYAEHLPEGHGPGSCGQRGKAEFWGLLERARAGVVPLREELLRRKRRHGDDLYARKDSHWTSLGALVLVEAALERLGGGIRVEPSEVVDPGRAQYTGDLTTLLGAPEQDSKAQRTVRRKPTAARVPGRTLLVGDSFSEAPIPLLRPYFADLRIVPWVGTRPRRIAAEIERADTVILETVEREIAFRASDAGPVQPVLRALRARLDRP